MAEYIEREALMAYPIRINHYDREHGKLDFVLGIESVMEYAENLPAADVVEVVRCKDCVHLHKEKMLCLNPHLKIFNTGHPTFSNHFCSYGERKDGAE